MSETTNTGERRRFQRILFDAPVHIRIGDARYPSLLIDISFKGGLIQTPQTWPMGSMGADASLLIELDAEDCVIRMDGQIAHEEAQHIGFHCTHIDMDSVTHLRRLVELNLGDPQSLERELEALG